MMELFWIRFLPEKHETIGINANIEVWNEHVVHSTKPFIPEESVRHPNLRGTLFFKLFEILRMLM